MDPIPPSNPPHLPHIIWRLEYAQPFLNSLIFLSQKLIQTTHKNSQLPYKKSNTHHWIGSSSPLTHMNVTRTAIIVGTLYLYFIIIIFFVEVTIPNWFNIFDMHLYRSSKSTSMSGGWCSDVAASFQFFLALICWFWLTQKIFSLFPWSAIIMCRCIFLCRQLF